MSQADSKAKRGRPKTLDRQCLIEAAMDAYWRDGAGLSLNEVVRRAGVSKPGVYREFGGEDGLMEAALDRYRELSSVPVLALIQADRPFAEVLDELLTMMTVPSDTPDGCLFTDLRLSRQRLGPATAARVAAIRDELREGYRAWFQRAQDRGEVDPAVTAEFAAVYLDTQITTLLVQLGNGEDPPTARAQAAFALGRLLGR